ncbi:MAG TPA: hypothetical protein IAA57_07020 [Candidatus Pullilachnospira intestinigallinarum]|nr:hypothetical protein [Candidatus Pullilachnospira intestinigallinarum]
MKKKYLLAVLCLTAVLAVSGCAKKETEEAESTPTPTPTPTQEAETLEMTEIPEVGEKTDTSAAIQLTNETGAEVTSVWLRVSGQEDWGEELVQESFTIPESESFMLNFEPEETAEDGTTAPVEAWDLSVGYEDGSYVVMNQVDLQAAAEMTMCWEDDVAFVKYQDPETQEEISTKEDEIARRQAEEAAAAQAEAEAAAQEEARKQAAEEEAQAQKEAEEAAQAQKEAEAAAAAQAQKEAEAAAAAQAQKEAEAAAAAQQQQQQQQQEENCANSSDNIVVNPDGSWYVAE